jgi:hypothetical protein
VVTYLYWAGVLLVMLVALAGIGMKLKQWPVGIAVASAVLLIGWAYYAFYLQQVLVKHYGGRMSISVPEGHRHIGSTWKDDNLWIENYDPATNTCTFQEYSRGNMLQGEVKIKNCSPLK